MVQKRILFFWFLIWLAVPIVCNAQFPKGYLERPSPVLRDIVVASDAEHQIGKKVTICGEVGGTRLERRTTVDPRLLIWIFRTQNKLSPL